jgi:hypothetical protein
VKWLAQLLGLGRVGPAPAGRSAALLAPTKGAQLDLRETAFPDGAVQLVSGQWCAVAKVTGWPLHARNSDEAMAFLSNVATALNALPGKLVLLSRSYPGGLEGYANERRARSRTASGPLAMLLRDQAQHASDRMAQGRYRVSAQFLVTHGKSKAEALALLNNTLTKLNDAGVAAETVGEALAGHIAQSWRPSVAEHFTVDFDGPSGETLAVLAYSPGGGARAVRPRYVAPTRPRVSGESRKALTA